MPARANEPQPFERLPSGRHGLTRETVLASQRGRLLDAMVQIVTEEGYADTTVSDVVERAGVARDGRRDGRARSRAAPHARCFVVAGLRGRRVARGAAAAR